MVHHYQVYGFFSEEVHDYNDLQIFDRFTTPEAQMLSPIIDPYRYLNNGRFEIPKLILNSAGDEFFVSDSSQFYFADLPGEDNYLRYIPNTGHGLDERAYSSISAFTAALLFNLPFPKFSWTVGPDGTITVHAQDTPTEVRLWQATRLLDRDFRDYGGTGPQWTSELLADQGGLTYVASVPTPADGATAFLVELTFDSGIPGVSHVFTTDVRVNTLLPLSEWPFPVGAPAILDTDATEAAMALAAEDATAGAILFAMPTAAAERRLEASTPVAEIASAGNLTQRATVPTVVLPADALAYMDDEIDWLEADEDADATVIDETA
jgi:hypothetical protein